jgi:hypothetical protein
MFAPSLSKDDIHMAQKVLTVLTDDIDGGEASQTITFAVDGVTYEIDVNDAHAGDLRGAFDYWIGYARKVSARGGVARVARRAGGSSDKARLAAIREWARKNGKKVSDRGRIPASIVNEYDAAN